MLLKVGFYLRTHQMAFFHKCLDILKNAFSYSYSSEVAVVDFVSKRIYDDELMMMKIERELSTDRARRVWWCADQSRWGRRSWRHYSQSLSSRCGRRRSRTRRLLDGRTATVWPPTLSARPRPADRPRCGSHQPPGRNCLVVDSLPVQVMQQHVRHQ